MIKWLKRNASIWWLAMPLIAIGLGLHLSVAILRYRADGDLWYLGIFFAMITLGAFAVRRVTRAFHPIL